MDNAEWCALPFDPRGGYGLYVQCVETQLIPLCASFVPLKSGDFIAKRFVHGKIHVCNRWAELPIGKPCGI